MTRIERQAAHEADKQRAWDAYFAALAADTESPTSANARLVHVAWVRYLRFCDLGE